MHYLSQILRFQEGRQIEQPPPEALFSAVSTAGEPDAGSQIAILVDLSPPSGHRSREIRALVLDTYMHSSGSVVARLRRALAAANRHLISMNEQASAGSKCIGSITCVVFAADEVFIGQVGSGCTLVAHSDPALLPDGVTHVYEGYPQRRDRTLIALGATIPPLIHIGYTVIGDQSTFLLATTAAYEMQPQDQWEDTLSIPVLEDVMARIRRVAATSQASGTVLLVRSLDAEDQEATALPTAPKRRQWLFGKHRKSPEASETISRPSMIPTGLPRPLPAEPSSGRAQPIHRPSVAAPAPEASVDEHAVRFTSGASTTPSASTPPRTTSAAQGTSKLPPRAEPSSSKQEAERPHLSLDGLHQSWLRFRRAYKTRRYQGRSTKAERDRLRAAMRNLLPVSPGAPYQAHQRKAPAEKVPMMSGLALGLMLVVFFITFSVYLQVGEPAKAEALVSEARELREQIYTTYEPEEWKRLLTLAERILALDANHVDAAQWRTEAQQALNNIDKIKILDVRQLLELSASPTPRRLLATESWIYLLNPTTDEVVGISLNGDLVSTSASAPTPILKRGQTFNGEIVEHLVDLAWIPQNANYIGGAVLIYSEGGTIYIYEPALGPGSTSRQRLLGNLAPGAVSLMKTYGERVYLVQRRDNQILVYEPVNGIYESPRGYFAEDVRRDLQSVLDIAIDGRIYLLSGDGKIHSYLSGTEDPFNLVDVPAPSLSPLVFGVDANPDTGLMYLGDAKNERIVVIDKRGNFRFQYRVPGNELRQLEALAIREQPHVLYFVAANRLYAAPLPAVSVP